MKYSAFFQTHLIGELDHLGLGLMPIVCGDLDLAHESETMLARRRKMPSDIMTSKAETPILSESAISMSRLVYFS